MVYHDNHNIRYSVPSLKNFASSFKLHGVYTPKTTAQYYHIFAQQTYSFIQCSTKTAGYFCIACVLVCKWFAFV